MPGGRGDGPGGASKLCRTHRPGAVGVLPAHNRGTQPSGALLSWLCRGKSVCRARPCHSAQRGGELRGCAAAAGALAAGCGPRRARGIARRSVRSPSCTGTPPRQRRSPFRLCDPGPVGLDAIPSERHRPAHRRLVVETRVHQRGGSPNRTCTCCMVQPVTALHRHRGEWCSTRRCDLKTVRPRVAAGAAA